jgi:serine/threonine-protein kinase
MKIHHAVETRTLGCIFGELVDGDSLRQHLARGRMTVAAAMRCIQDVLRGLAHVHATGVLHRDIKPSNLILRRSDRRVVLVDFGIARLPASDLTRMGDQMGTAHYVSPEQWRGDEIDIRTDIYAAGATFYHLLTGRPPYGGAPEHALMQKFHTDAPRPSSLVPDVPVALDQVVAEAMAFKPAYRYRTSEEFAVAIARAAAEAPDFARSSGAPVRRTERRSRQGIEARKQGGLLRDLAELFMD